MTTENTCEEIECEDGITRPADECVHTDTGWHAIDDCVEVNGAWYDQNDDQVCYVERHGEFFLTEECTIVDGDWEHDDDCTHCACCCEACITDDMSSDPNGDYICDGCYERHCSCCDSCGDTCWDDDLEDGVCEDCREAAPQLISSYGDKSANHLRSETRDKLRFGVELEVEGYDNATQAAKYIRQFLPADYCTLKRDGSLGEAGVEIVTRPDSMAVHKRLFDALFADSPGRALSSWNTGRCGMHVHVSRAALSHLQIGKMMCFLNEPSAANFLAKIAGRKPCHWCKVHKKKIGDFRRDGDRYTAFNVTNKQTVEIRIFKGTLAAAGFFKNLEFVAALVEFTAPATRSIAQATSHRAFCDWLPKKQYPHLHAFLTAKGFIRRRSTAAAA
jgi:hypothetical protein